MTAVTVPRSLHLPPRYLEIVLDILRRYLPQAEVWAYGSRVNGDHYDASDLDLVARRPDDLSRRQPDLDEVAAAFSDSDLPILVQILDWARIPPAFREEIEAGYVVLQPADCASAAPPDADSHVLAPALQRGSVVGPPQRPVSTHRTAPPGRCDAEASPLAPTLEPGSQKQSTTLATFGELIGGGVLDVTDGYRAKNSEIGNAKELTPLTVLLGPNGSGKSTVFAVFAFLCECFEQGLRRAWDRRGLAKELMLAAAKNRVKMADSQVLGSVDRGAR